MKAVEIHNISKRFGDKIVLDNISFEIEEGEIFGLIGPNGAGKSTLINIITTVLQADNGSINICGYDINKEPLKAKKAIGYVPQDLALFEDLNGFANLEYFGALYGLKGKELKERINEALEITGLKDQVKVKVKKYSGGMKRRLNIAAAIMHHPKVLILDEPTVGVDPQSRNHIFSFIKEIGKKWGTTVMYTSHYMEEVEELCERVFIIDTGKEVSYGSKEEVKNSVFPFNSIVIHSEKIDSETLISLRDIEGVTNIDEEETTQTLTINDKFKLIDALKIYEDKNINIKKISYEEAKLEDVFLALTGKSLRD